MPLAAFFLAMVQPLIGRILVTLGFSIVSIVGMTATLDAIKSQFLSYLGQVPAAGMQLALLSGAGEAMGIIFGACATRLVLNLAMAGTRMLGTSGT